MPKHVAVLMGGFSSERPVSLSSGSACADALEEVGYRVTRVDVDRDIGEVLGELKPDVVFNALHGPYGEDGTIQGILEYLAIPYTHSGVLASALGMHKPTARRLFVEAGLPVADGMVIRREKLAAGDPMARPFVVKPINEGSSVGVRLVFQGDNFDAKAELAHLISLLAGLPMPRRWGYSRGAAGNVKHSLR